jgi:hypothetical protein
MQRLFLAALCFLVFGSCNPDVDANFSTQLVVQGFLYANEPLDSIIVRRTLPIDTRSPDDRVDGASVILSVGDSSYQLIGVTGGKYVSASPITIQPGKTYRLLVAWNSDTARAETTVPLPIQIVSATLNGSPLADTIVYDTTRSSPPIHLWWSTSQGCAGYGLEALSLDTTRSDTIVSLTDKSLPDSNAFGRYRFFIISTNEQIVWQQFRYFGPNVIRVLALDQNYQDYILGLSLSRSQFNNNTLHVSGGLGVFGSAARASRLVFLK